MKEVRYFYVPGAATQQELPAEEAAHALRVLRLKNDDEIFLMDGEGSFYRAVITHAEGKHCLYHIEETIPQEKTWQGRMHLAIAPTKMMERMEWMAEKATEVGMDELSFLCCQFSLRRTLRRDRIEKIVVGAVKQSRKSFMPQVNEMQGFREFITAERPGRKFIAHCYEEFARNDLYQLLQETAPEEDVTVLVGPEGDFSVEEVRLAMEHGYESVTLGSSRLRTETAGLASVMMFNLLRRR